jgi:hypothetical protein
LRKAWQEPPGFNGGPAFVAHPELGLLVEMRFLKLDESKFKRLVLALQSLPSYDQHRALDPDCVRLLWGLPEAVDQSLAAMYEQRLIEREHMWRLQGEVRHEVARILGGPYTLSSE